MDVITARPIDFEPLTLPSSPEAAYGVTLRLGQWYAARRVELPLETQAEFARMAFEALVRNPQRRPAEVLDELVAELDGMLEDILADPHAPRGHAVEDAGPDGQDRDPSWLQRFLQRRR